MYDSLNTTKTGRNLRRAGLFKQPEYEYKEGEQNEECGDVVERVEHDNELVTQSR